VSDVCAIERRPHVRTEKGEQGERMGSFTSGSGIDTRDFTKRGSDTDDDEGDEDPAPDDVDGAAADERVDERGGEAVGDRGEHKGHEGDLERGAVARQLRLVSEVLEQLVGRLGLADRQTRRRVLELGIHVAGAGGVVLEVGARHGFRAGWLAGWLAG